ncbi:MAG: hypothetical protein ACOZCF_13605 [Bacillota bacterium]
MRLYALTDDAEARDNVRSVFLSLKVDRGRLVDPLEWTDDISGIKPETLVSAQHELRQAMFGPDSEVSPGSQISSPLHRDVAGCRACRTSGRSPACTQAPPSTKAEYLSNDALTVSPGDLLLR